MFKVLKKYNGQGTFQTQTIFTPMNFENNEEITEQNFAKT